MSAVSKMWKMQNIDRIRQIHNEGVIKMQIACLLVLLWCMAQDPRACIPLTLCWLGGRKETELGKTNGQSYHRPYIMRVPHRKTMTTWEWEALQEQAALHTVDSRLLQDFRKVLEQREAQQQQFSATSIHLFWANRQKWNFLQVGETWYQNAWKALH